MDKKEALENALKQIEKDFGKGSIMRLGEATGQHERRSHSHGHPAAGHSPWGRRASSRAHRRSVRAGILRQDDGDAAHDRRSPAARRVSGLHRRRARPRPGIRKKIRRRYGKPPDLSARQRRTGLRDRGSLGAKRCHRHHRRGLRGRLSPQGGD